ncbi:MAG TPA: hypothetical protein VKA84_24550, partial [Gemmatimonadaceae bacterium]|nr:hypothetical protein [Gemmatimonadaceae bacterium]
MRPIRPSLAIAFSLVAAATATAACSDDEGPQSPAPPRGIVVLNGFGDPGITLLADTGTASTHVSFDPFDGSTFSLENDTVLATASKSAGNLLYVADARTGDATSIQLPVNSNPANARFIEQPGVGRVVAVALRDSNAVALVKVSGAGAGGYTQLKDAGVCPTDAFRDASTIFVVASNQRCVSDYHTFGQAYVVYVPDATPLARETIQLASSARGAGSVVVLRDTAYIFTVGTLTFNGDAAAPPAVSRVDLRRRQLIGTLALTGAFFGNVMRLGADGVLYVSAYTSSSF